MKLHFFKNSERQDIVSLKNGIGKDSKYSSIQEDGGYKLCGNSSNGHTTSNYISHDTSFC